MNMKAVEVTIQNLIGSGMDPKTENNPYLGFIYTSFQERATKISHGNTARHALEHGDDTLAKICGLIAADEGRHESESLATEFLFTPLTPLSSSVAYQRIMDAVFEKDTNGALIAFADMMRKQIVMPAHLMNDLEHEKANGRNLFADFSAVADRTGTYTAFDYADIMEHLIARWEVPKRAGLSGEAAEAQEYLVKLPDRIRKLTERANARKKKGASASFSWIFNRSIDLN